MKKYTKQTKVKTPLVSVVIPVFNGDSFIEQTVNSVLKSTYKNFEIILVDDGSTDSSKKTCTKIAKQSKKIKFYSFEKNKGMDKALKLALSSASGKYIARINQDDLMRPTRLQKQVSFLEKNKDHVAVGGYTKMFTKTNKNFDVIKFPLKDEEIKAVWMKLSPFADPAVMYRKSAYLKTKGYNQAMWPVDDVHMWYMLGKIGKLANLPVILTDVRWHESAGSMKNHKIQMKKLLKVHIWANKNVQKAKLSDWMFWFAQSLAGYTFGPKFNWAVYRLIKKINYFLFKKALTKKYTKVTKLIKKPTIKSLSGV